MSTVDPILAMYEQVGRGEVPPPVDYNEYKRLLAKARRMTSSDDEAERLLAVDVAVAVGRNRGMDVVRMFLDDASVAVRRRCIEGAVADGETGLLVLRKALNDDDPALVLEALGWLRRAADRGSASSLRRLTRSEDPRVRAAAAEMIGHVAGPGLVIALRPLLDDPDEAVRDAAAEATRRLDGDLPQDPPDPWWGPAEDETFEARAAVDLPETLPEDIGDLLRLLGRVAEEDRGPVLEALQAHPMSALGRIVRTCRPNDTRELSIGAAIAGQAFARGDWVVPLRRLLPDEDPAVRVAVADCLAVIGQPSVVMGVKGLLEAPQPQVRAAAVRCLAALTEGRELEGYLALVAGDADPTVQAAVEAARS